MYVDVYISQKCPACKDMKKAIGKGPKVRAKSLKVYEVIGNNRKSVITGKTDKMPLEIKAFPSVVISSGSMRRIYSGEDAIQLIEFGAINAGTALSKCCPYRKMKKCIGDRCQKWVVLLMDGLVPAAYCSDVWDVELNASILKTLTTTNAEIKNLGDVVRNIDQRVDKWDLEKTHQQK